MYSEHEREISKEEYEAITSGDKDKYSLWHEAIVFAYSLVAFEPFERDGKYYIPYTMADSCD